MCAKLISVNLTNKNYLTDLIKRMLFMLWVIQNYTINDNHAVHCLLFVHVWSSTGNCSVIQWHKWSSSFWWNRQWNKGKSLVVRQMEHTCKFNKLKVTDQLVCSKYRGAQFKNQPCPTLRSRKLFKNRKHWHNTFKLISVHRCICIVMNLDFSDNLKKNQFYTPAWYMYKQLIKVDF